MGTNYYWSEHLQPACPACGHQPTVQELHIGKSSAGWVFALHVYPEQGIHDLDDWKERFQRSCAIWDEYGTAVSISEMLKTITERKWTEPKWRKVLPAIEVMEFYRMNDCLDGPNGCLRAKLRPNAVIKHGAGTWDCRVGEFS